MEACQDCNRVSRILVEFLIHTDPFFRRSHLQEGLKTKSWDLRMHKTMKEQAIRKLEADMRQEKLDERQRLVP